MGLWQRITKFVIIYKRRIKINEMKGGSMHFERIPVTKIKVNKEQSRRKFDKDSLSQLAESMEEVGQLQPVIVKKEGENYKLVAGERRLRATKINNEKKIAAIVLDEEVTEETLRQIQLIENIQREDLNPLERALAIQRFIDDNKLTKKDASKKLGVPRTTLTEWLNILDVPEKYQREVIDKDSPLSLSHISLAKALASRTGDPTKLTELLDGVLKYNLNRNETKKVTEIFHRYLHLPMKEAISAVLLRREHLNLDDREKDNQNKDKSNPVKGLLQSLSRTSDSLEEVMEKVGILDKEEKEGLIDEFLYIYQMIEIIIPEFRDKGLEKMINEIRERNIDKSRIR